MAQGSMALDEMVQFACTPLWGGLDLDNSIVLLEVNMTLTPEYRAALLDLDHPDEWQRIFAALWLFNNLPMAELAHCTPRQINQIAAKIDPRPE
jgi:hypothetical protein